MFCAEERVRLGERLLGCPPPLEGMTDDLGGVDPEVAAEYEGRLATRSPAVDDRGPQRAAAMEHEAGVLADRSWQRRGLPECHQPTGSAYVRTYHMSKLVDFHGPSVGLPAP